MFKRQAYQFISKWGQPLFSFLAKKSNVQTPKKFRDFMRDISNEFMDWIVTDGLNSHILKDSDTTEQEKVNALKLAIITVANEKGIPFDKKLVELPLKIKGSQ